MRSELQLSVGLLIALAVTVGCSKEQKKEGTAEPTTETTAAAAPAGDPAAEAKDYFKKTCVVCHGDHGKGDGVGAASLDPKPRAFGDPEWQKSVTDDQIKKTIIAGGVAVGKSAVMPGNPQLKSKPAVVDELVKIIRGFDKH